MSDSSFTNETLRAALEARAAALPQDAVSIELDELMAYVLNFLPDDDREELQERIVNDPAAARLAAAMAEYETARNQREAPLVESPSTLSSDEQNTDWQRLAGRLGIEPPAAEPLPPTASPAGTAYLPANPQRPRTWLVAASWVAAAGFGLLSWWWTNTTLKSPRVLQPEASLAEDATKRGGANPQGLRNEGGNRLLTLELEGADDEVPNPRNFSTQRLEIWLADQGKAPLWQTRGQLIDDQLEIQLLLPSRFLDRGRYQIRLYGLSGKEAPVPLATFSFEER